MLDGRTAYAARFKGESPRNFTPFDELSRRGREIWQSVEEAVRLEVIKPIPGWREAGAEDPHGTRYQCRREQIAGGHLTDDQAAFAVSYIDRLDPSLEGVLAVARDRIRWLSRRNHYLEGQLREVRHEAGAVLMERDALRLELSAAKSSLEATVRDATGMREELAIRASKIRSLESRMPWDVIESKDGSVLIGLHPQDEGEPREYVAYVPADRLELLQAERVLPPFGLPSGSLQAYSDAYKKAYEPERKHLEGHIAGLRAVLEHFPEGARKLEELPEACEDCNGTGINPNKLLLSHPPKPAKCEACDGSGVSPTQPASQHVESPLLTHLRRQLGLTITKLQEAESEVERLQGDAEDEADLEPMPYRVLATLYDGTKILAPYTLSDNFSTASIQDAIRDLYARTRGPRSGDMADVVDAINGEAAR
jgi:hypothetical protein